MAYLVCMPLIHAEVYALAVRGHLPTAAADPRRAGRLAVVL